MKKAKSFDVNDRRDVPSDAEHGSMRAPIGAALVENGNGVLIALGRNRRVQYGDPIAHGEMDCLRSTGRRRSRRNAALHTALSPCMMCWGTVLRFRTKPRSGE